MEAPPQPGPGATVSVAPLVLGSGRYGTFVQRFRLPDDAEPEGVRADYDRGVLKVTIPKRAATSHPQILIMVLSSSPHRRGVEGAGLRWRLRFEGAQWGWGPKPPRAEKTPLRSLTRTWIPKLSEFRPPVAAK